MKQSPEISEQADVILLTDNGDGITTVTLNRPNQYNALSEQVLTDMQLLLDQLSERDDIKVVIIASTGDAFCTCLLYTSPSPRDLSTSRMPSSA